MSDINLEMARLKWACRRGMLELDILFSDFLFRDFPSLSAEQRQIFVDLLSCNDQELYSWLVKGHPPSNDKFLPIIHMIKHSADAAL